MRGGWDGEGLAVRIVSLVKLPGAAASQAASARQRKRAIRAETGLSMGKRPDYNARQRVARTG
jgi:hypothetical protein